MNGAIRIIVLTTIIVGMSALPGNAFTVKLFVPPGTISMIYTTSTTFSNGNTVSFSNSLCPSSSSIEIDMPDDSVNSSSITAGFFIDAGGNATGFEIDPNSFVDGGDGTGDGSGSGGQPAFVD